MARHEPPLAWTENAERLTRRHSWARVRPSKLQGDVKSRDPGQPDFFVGPRTTLTPATTPLHHALSLSPHRRSFTPATRLTRFFVGVEATASGRQDHDGHADTEAGLTARLRCLNTLTDGRFGIVSEVTDERQWLTREVEATMGRADM